MDIPSVPSPGIFNLPSIGTPLHQPEEDLMLPQTMSSSQMNNSNNLSSNNNSSNNSGMGSNHLFMNPHVLMQPQTPVSPVGILGRKMFSNNFSMFFYLSESYEPCCGNGRSLVGDAATT